MSQRTVIGVIASALVVTMVVLGLTVIGSPTKARNKESDRLRVDRLSQLHHELENHANEKGQLPGSLKELRDVHPEVRSRFDPTRDPETGDFWEYRKLEPRKYEICATFHEASEQPGTYYSVPRGEPNFYSHGPGRQCFTHSVRAAYGQGGFPSTVEPDFIYED